MTLVERLGKVFQAAFGFDAAKFSAEIVPQDVSKWDSIGHMTLVAELEKVVLLLLNMLPADE